MCRYLKQKAECDKSPTCEMGGFTRLLHSGHRDELMDEIPTFVAQPLPESVVPHEYYPVLNRPYALLQWVQQANISEEYVMMSEPDHIFLRPMINFMKSDDRPAAFPFFYIEPHKVQYRGCQSQCSAPHSVGSHVLIAVLLSGKTPRPPPSLAKSLTCCIITVTEGQGHVSDQLQSFSVMLIALCHRMTTSPLWPGLFLEVKSAKEMLSA